jgi:broad specificity phosphatase PhoE
MGVVLLVRHGQASFGAEDYDVLSENGVEQSRLLGAALVAQGLTPTRLVHGAMRRQRDTAVAMAQGGRWTAVPELDEGWDEFDHLGVVARGTAGEVDQSDPRAFQLVFERATERWYGGLHDADYAESWTTFVTRVRGALDRALDRALDPGRATDGVTVVVSSGGPIAVVCATLVDPVAAPSELPRSWTLFNTVTANASVTRVLEGERGRRLLSFNEHLHLPRGLVTYR